MSKNPKKIMIVEDDPSIMANMTEAFEMFGRKLIVAENGKAAIETLKKLNSYDYPSCIILDLMMPEMTGEEFIFQIQALGKFELDSIPIIVSSAAPKIETMNEPRVKYKLRKPMNLSDLEIISSEYL